MAWRLMQYRGAYDDLVANCDEDLRFAIVERLAFLMIYGTATREPVSKSLGEGLFEVRARAKRVHARLLFGFLPAQQIVIVWAGTKDHRRLSPEIIRTARRLLTDAKLRAEALADVTLR
jgi:hypothetical protein